MDQQKHIDNLTCIRLTRIRDTRKEWKTETKTFNDLHSQICSGLFNLDPQHQRNVVHNDDWKSNIIHSVVYDQDIPDVYFHPCMLPDGTLRNDSLDGKQRCSAIVDFLNGKFKYANNEPYNENGTPLWKGKYFSELMPGVQSFLKNECSIKVRIATRMLLPDEIESFFQKRQETKKTVAGEHLNSCISSNINECIKKYVADPENESKMKDAGFNSNDRFQYTEALAFMLRVYKHYTDDTIDCSAAKIREWFSDPRNQDLDEINKAFELVDRVLEILTVIKIANGNGKKNAYRSLASYLMNYCWVKDSEEFDDEKIQHIKNTLSDCETINLPKVDGNHGWGGQREYLRNYIDDKIR